MLLTTPHRAIHDYGALDVFAALEVATGKLITDLRNPHAAVDFIGFSSKIDREVPAALDVDVIPDSLITHKTPQ